MRKSINTDPGVKKILELVEKDIKTFITFFMFKRIEERLSKINSHWNYLKNPNQTSRVKTTVFERKTAVDIIHSRLSSKTVPKQ